MKHMYILFDIGGTNMRITASKDGRSFGPIFKEKTPKKYSDGLKLFIKMARQASGGGKIKAVCGGIAGIHDKKHEELFYSPNLPLWSRKPLKKDLEKALKAPFIMENDAAVVGLGEAVYGAGKGYGIAVYFTVSTGVGGARIVDKQIDKKVYGFEPGWQIVNLGSPDFGDFKNLQSCISGRAIRNQYGLAPKDIKDKKVWTRITKILAVGLHNSIIHWSPEVVVLGGAMIGDISLSDLKKELKKVMKTYPEIPAIKKFSLGDKAGFYGALLLLKNSFKIAVNRKQ